MDIKKFLLGRTLGFIVVGAVFLVGCFFLFNNYIYQEKQGDGIVVEPYRATLEGEYVCLSYKDGVETEAGEADCEPGMKTDVGEYYAVNFFLMSQMHAPLKVGQYFSANGVVMTDESSDPQKWQRYKMEGIFSVTDSLTVRDEGGDEPYMCTADAKLCPDGSYVGRQGPDCEFAACPSVATRPTQVTVALDDSVQVLDVTLSPQEVVSDSRCPVGVECVWAGVVEVRTTLATTVAHGEHVLTLGEPQTFGEYTVTLVEVLPMKTQEAIPDSSYQFTYSVSHKDI